MLLTRVITWRDLVGEREAWSVFLYFTTVLTLADGLNRTGFITWLAGRAAAPLQGIDPTRATAHPLSRRLHDGTMARHISASAPRTWAQSR